MSRLMEWLLTAVGAALAILTINFAAGLAAAWMGVL